MAVVALRRGNVPPGSWLRPADEAGVVAGGEYAAVEIPRGTLLTAAALTSNPPPGAGEQIVGLDLKGSQAPVPGVPAGAQVLVLDVPSASQPPDRPAQPVGTATVWYSGSGGSGGTNVDLVVSADQASTVAGEASDWEISLVRTSG